MHGNAAMSCTLAVSGARLSALCSVVVCSPVRCSPLEPLSPLSPATHARDHHLLVFGPHVASTMRLRLIDERHAEYARGEPPPGVSLRHKVGNRA
jgi:hypothetical protein